MSEYSVRPEILKEVLAVRGLTADKLNIIQNKLNKKMSVAFLVNGNFDIFISTTNAHKDIDRSMSDEVIEKGTISGSKREIVWITSDNIESRKFSGPELETLRTSIKDKINDSLDLDYHLK